MFEIFHKSITKMELNDLKTLAATAEGIENKCADIKKWLDRITDGKAPANERINDKIKQNLKEILLLFHHGDKEAQKTIKDELEREKRNVF